MKKQIVLGASLLASASAMAGGLLTNTNQNAAFLRQMSQNATMDITSLYVNPAGTAFLSDGWHLSLNIQSAFQKRNIETTFPLYAYNLSNPGNATHTFKGNATAPVIPSFQLSYNKGKWSVNANFALCGGGGKCEFANGLGSFEALYAGQLYQQVPAAVQAAVPGIVSAEIQKAGVPAAMADQIAATGTYGAQFAGYNLNPYMKGRQYNFGLTLGATYKFLENLSGFVGVRGVYATNNYNGYVQDVKADCAYSYDIPAIPNMFPGLQGQGKQSLDLNDNTLTLNCDQTGFGITPIIGIDWKINKHWNVAAKYEFCTKMNLKNKTEMNAFAQAQAADPTSALAQFKDGEKVRENIPAILAYGAQYSPIEAVRINAGMNIYFDKNARRYNNKQELIDKNTFEYNAGAEWDINKYITVSASWQSTNYGLSDAFMNDLSFNLSSNSLGCGLRINATERCAIDLGYMHTFYKDMTVVTPTAAGNKTDVYSRKNDVVGIGVNIAF